MKVRSRLQRLERQLNCEAAEVARRDELRFIRLLLLADPMPMGAFATLLNKEAALAKSGLFLSPAECEEGVRLAIHLTARLRQAEADAGLEPDGTVFTYERIPRAAFADRGRTARSRA